MVFPVLQMVMHWTVTFFTNLFNDSMCCADYMLYKWNRNPLFVYISQINVLFMTYGDS